MSPVQFLETPHLKSGEQSVHISLKTDWLAHRKLLSVLLYFLGHPELVADFRSHVVLRVDRSAHTTDITQTHTARITQVRCTHQCDEVLQERYQLQQFTVVAIDVPTLNWYAVLQVVTESLGGVVNNNSFAQVTAKN